MKNYATTKESSFNILHVKESNGALDCRPGFKPIRLPMHTNVIIFGFDSNLFGRSAQF